MMYCILCEDMLSYPHKEKGYADVVKWHNKSMVRISWQFNSALQHQMKKGSMETNSSSKKTSR